MLLHWKPGKIVVALFELGQIWIDFAIVGEKNGFGEL